MKIALLTIGAALLSAQYVAGAYPKVSAHTSSGAILLQTAGTKSASGPLELSIKDTKQKLDDALTTLPVLLKKLARCNYEQPKFQKVVTIQADDKSITKNDLKFNKHNWWMKKYVVDKTKGKFTVTMNCDCCHPTGELCIFKCEEGAFIHISAEGNSGQKTQLWLNNDYIDGTGKRKRDTKHGDLLFSVSSLDIGVATDNAKVTSEYKKYGSRRSRRSRRKLLQVGTRGGMC